MSKIGIVYAKEVPMIKVKQVKEINGKGTPLHTVIQYWTKDGILVAEGQMTQKIPFRGGVRADKQYRNTAVVFLQDIRGESHLFVEVYENKKRELQTPWIRMVFTQKDWGLYYPDAGVWSAAGLDEEREKIGSNCKKRDNKCYMARSQGDMVWKFTGDTWERKYTTWVGALQSLIYNIKAQRVRKREDKRADRLKEREQNTPPLPKGLEDWAKKTGIGTEHFLYYKRHGRYADITCSACGQVTEAAVRRKDTYEGQFEKIIPVPQHDSVGTCPHCGAAGVYKAQGKAKGVWGHGMNCFIAQRYKDDGAVIRYVEIEKIYRLDTFLDEKEIMIGAGEKMIITEIARTYLEKGKRPQTDYHKFSSYSGEFWDDCNLCGMNNISIKAAKIYPESYKELRTTSSTANAASNAAQNALSVLNGISTLDALGAALSNDAHVVHTNTDGTGGDYSECKTQMTVYLGDTDVSYDCVFTVTQSAGITGKWDAATATYFVTAMSTSDGYVDIDALYGTGDRYLTTRKGLRITTRSGKYMVVKSGGSHIRKRFSISKAPDGK